MFAKFIDPYMQDLAGAREKWKNKLSVGYAIWGKNTRTNPCDRIETTWEKIGVRTPWILATTFLQCPGEAKARPQPNLWPIMNI